MTSEGERYDKVLDNLEKAETKVEILEALDELKGAPKSPQSVALTVAAGNMILEKLQ